MGANLVKLDSGDSSTDVSGLYRTKYYSAQPSVLPLGQNHSSLSAAQRETAKLGFYDKECPLSCTSSSSTSAGANAKNGATSNVGNSPDLSRTVKGVFGAKSQDNFNGNYFEFFRDNSPKTVRPDVWYPRSGINGVTYNGDAPKTTLVTRWSGGTPVLGNEFNVSYLNKDTKKQENIFDAKNTASQPTQKNFETKESIEKKESLFKTSTAAQVKGLLDEITVKSTWASDANKPQSLQFAWEYSTSVTSKVPTSLGFTSGSGNASVGSYVNRSTAVDGRCVGEFGSTAQTNFAETKNKLQSNTGTGISPSFSGVNGDYNNKNNLVLNFIRGTSE